MTRRRSAKGPSAEGHPGGKQGGRRAARETGRGARRPRRWRWIAISALLAAGLALGVLEFRASVISARAFSARARTYTYRVLDGPAREPLRAPQGPYDIRLGYTRLPDMVEAAAAGGFEVSRQARPSEALREYVAEGLAPPFPERSTAGLRIEDESGRTLFEVEHPQWTYDSFDAVPEVVWRSLLWIEDRELALSGPQTRNPAIDWDRLARAFLDLGLSVVDRDRRVPGGSTLATQIEKFRHSPGGRTSGFKDKWRQMVSASTRAYREGLSTGSARREIILTYLNSVPLAAHPDWGEVTGLGEGVHVWFGADPRTDTELLSEVSTGAQPTPAHAEAYVRALALILSERRPSFYLRSPEGRRELAALVEGHAPRLVEAGVIAPALAEALPVVTAAAIGITRDLVPADSLPPTVRRHLDVHTPRTKAAAAIRSRLLPLLGVESLYDLDRLDLEVVATYDSALQAVATELLSGLTDPAVVAREGLQASGLLGGLDPGPVRYSLLLIESVDGLNRVRVETDNLEGLLNLNAAGRLELGSTAKLRTLVTYLESIGAAYDRLRPLSPGDLAALSIHPRDALSAWVRDQLEAEPSVARRDVLRRAMDRTYSASPEQRFATGGGIQTFRNFDSAWDRRRPTVREAFRHSVNLPFVRMLREVVDHIVFRPGSPSAAVLSAPDSVRRPYLERFVRAEATQYLTTFDRTYAGLDTIGVRTALAENRWGTPRAVARALRWVDPGAELDAFVDAVTDGGARPLPPGFDPAAEYAAAAPGTLSLADVAYLSSIHPLELWVARFRLGAPSAPRAELLAAGAAEANEVYRWLLDSRRRSSQDPRIYSILEIDAFEEILAGWRRVGYPYRNIVPSIGTAIGSSGDRPAALAELVGIVLNDGMRLPQARVGSLTLGAGTPYEVALDRPLSFPERVLDPVIARLVREAMIDVADQGTARRARNAFQDPEGQRMVLGGKTGTGDNRSRSGPDGREQVRNRTSTLVFFAGERWFGVVTVYVPGEAAGAYRFTSALASEVLRIFGTRAGPLRTSS